MAAVLHLTRASLQFECSRLVANREERERENFHSSSARRTLDGRREPTARENRLLARWRKIR